MDNGGSPLIGSILFIVLLILEGLLSVFVYAVDNCNESNVEEDAKEGNKKAMRILYYLDNLINLKEELHIITAICYSIACIYCLPNIAIALILKFSVEVTLYRYLVFAGVIILGFVLLASNYMATAKIGAVKEEKAAYVLLGIANVSFAIAMPIRKMLSFLSNILVRIVGVDPNKNLDEVSEDEIISMVNEGHEQGVIESSEAEMIHNIFEFTDKDAEDIMIHRKNMIMLPADMTFGDAFDFVLENKISRFPVYEEDVDNIIGVIHIRDIFERVKEQDIYELHIKDVKGLIRDIQFIPETRSISNLFNSMQQEKNHMVIVVDEYGQTSGLVTMEDILEEIVGNIFDEYDEENQSIVRLMDGSFQIDGMTPLEEVSEALGINLPEEDFDTMNGYLIGLIDHIPSEEEKIKITADGYRFEVLSVENKMIHLVHAVKLPQEQTDDVEEN